MIRDLVLIKLQQVGLRGAAGLFPAELSGGMARRVALARAVALDPQLIMYDEPFAGLDPIAMGVVVKLNRTLNQVFGMTSVVVSHDISETASIADLIYVVADGVVVGTGSPEDLLRADTPRVKQFVQGLPDGPVPFHYPARELSLELMGAAGHRRRVVSADVACAAGDRPIRFDGAWHARPLGDDLVAGDRGTAAPAQRPPRHQADLPPRRAFARDRGALRILDRSGARAATTCRTPWSGRKKSCAS